jgi:hypothetical protein
LDPRARGGCTVDGVRTGLTIGEFATLSYLSVRTRRRYREAGLLEPAAIGPSAGYRYYSAEQIPPARTGSAVPT